MPWKGLKPHIIILSLLISMALIFGAQRLYQGYFISGPLNNVLSANQAVESYHIGKEGGMLLVSVHFKSDTGLMNPYKEMKKNLERVMGNRDFMFVLDNNKDDTLDQVWYRCQYSVYQAQVRGDFVEMAGTISSQAAACGAEADITIDQENIYLRLRHGDHTLDKVISRSACQAPGNNTPVAGGSDND